MAKSKTKFLLTVIITIVSLVLLALASFAATIGDVDVNGEIKAADARLALRAAVGLENLTKEQFTAADVDCSGDIKASDARSILRAAVGLEKLNREHKFSEWKTQREANCLKTGIKTRSCPCGETEVQESPTTKHSWSTWEVVTEATLQKEGSEQRICYNCYSVEKRTIEKLPIPEEPTTETPEQCEHSFGNWVITVQPTCAKTGTKERKCICGETQTATIPATGNHTFGEWTVKTQPTCGSDGIKSRTCVCGKIDSKIIPATDNHTFGKWIIKAQPTCAETGAKERKCACGETQTESIPATGNHTFGEWVVTTQPACDSAGIMSKTCSCGKIESEIIPATGNHTFGEWSIKTQPTCAKAGTKVRKCTCGKTQTETIPATGKHTIKQTGIVDATCTGKDGYYKWQCTVCKKTGSTPIPAGHTYEIEHATVSQSKICSRCGFVAEKSFNEYVNPIKTQPHILSHLSISENSSKVTEDNLKINRTKLFLLLTSMGGYSAKEANKEIDAIEDAIKNGMNYTETVNSIFNKNRTLTNHNYPIEGSSIVSELEDADVVSYTVEKVGAVDFREFLSNTYIAKDTAIKTDIVYDTSKYRYLESDNLIKLTVVLNTEKYSEIKDSDIEKTALMKATGVDIRELANDVLDLNAGADMEGFASAVCNEITTDATIIVYIDTVNNEPVASCYISSTVCEPTLTMNLLGMIEGSMDFTTDSKVISLYFFDDYFTE